MSGKPIAAGKSSFDLVDTDRLFSEPGLKQDTVLLDAACGRGAYSLVAAKRIGPGGRVYAFDLWEEGIAFLKSSIDAGDIRNIHAEVADVGKRIPLGTDSVDVCLMATVLHDLIEDGTDAGALREIGRVMKSGGTLAVVEFKKMEGPPGPPFRIRRSPLELERHLKPYQFGHVRTMDVGSYHYLSVFAALKE